MMNEQLANIRFGPDGFVPAVVQDADDGTVLMLAEMNREALERTLQTGLTHVWSQSQQGLYQPGEDAGQMQHVTDVKHSDGGDTLLIQVRQAPGGPAGQRSHFSRSLVVPTMLASGAEPPTVTEMPAALYDLILSRREGGDEKSTCGGCSGAGRTLSARKLPKKPPKW